MIPHFVKHFLQRLDVQFVQRQSHHRPFLFIMNPRSGPAPPLEGHTLVDRPPEITIKMAQKLGLNGHQTHKALVLSPGSAALRQGILGFSQDTPNF